VPRTVADVNLARRIAPRDHQIALDIVPHVRKLHRFPGRVSVRAVRKRHVCDSIILGEVRETRKIAAHASEEGLSEVRKRAEAADLEAAEPPCGEKIAADRIGILLRRGHAHHDNQPRIRFFGFHYLPNGEEM
jgi:hypothetical protein